MAERSTEQNQPMVQPQGFRSIDTATEPSSLEDGVWASASSVRFNEGAAQRINGKKFVGLAGGSVLCFAQFGNYVLIQRREAVLAIANSTFFA